MARTAWEKKKTRSLGVGYKPIAQRPSRIAAIVQESRQPFSHAKSDSEMFFT